MDSEAQTAAEVLEIVRAREFTIDNDLDTLFVIWATSLVLFMQVGFLLLEFGHVQPKNSRTVIMKNTLDNAFGILAWFLLGSMLSGGAYGKGNGYVGTAWKQTLYQWHSVQDTPPEQGDSVSSHPDALWSFYFAFASSAATIVSGAIAERAQLRAHLILSVCMCGLIYPIAAYWVWGQNGWLSGLSGNAVFDVGVIDVAGGGVVHVLGGTAALVSAYILGPRTGCPPNPETSSPRTSDGSPKFSKGSFTGDTVRVREHEKDVVIYNAARPAARAMIALGAFIMWFTWYGFNIGSLGGISGRSAVASHAMLTTTLAGMSGAVTSVVCTKFTSCFSFTISTTCNGMVAGLVASAAICAIVPAWAAIIAGAAAAILAQALAHLCPFIGIDDPVNAGPTHFSGGVVGMLCVALFAERPLLAAYLFRDVVKEVPDVGLVFGGSGKLLAVQLLGIVVILAWSGLVTGALMMLLKALGMLRQSLEVEILGMDAQMFEVKQRDEKLAFKVIQHIRAAEEKEQGRRKQLMSCFTDPGGDDLSQDTSDMHPFRHAALNRRIAALSAASVPPRRLSLSTTSTGSYTTHSTGGLPLSATPVSPATMSCSTPPSPATATSTSSHPPPPPSARGAAAAAAAAATAATAAGGAAAVGAHGGSMGVGHSAGAANPVGPSPLGTTFATSISSRIFSTAAAATAPGGMFSAHQHSHAQPASQYRNPSTSHSMSTLMMHDSVSEAIPTYTPCTPWPIHPPPSAPPDPARLLKNVHAVAASSHPSIRGFQNILEGSNGSSSSTNSFYTSSSSARHNSSSVLGGDRSELTFAADLAHSESLQSFSPAAERSSSSPHSPPNPSQSLWGSHPPTHHPSSTPPPPTSLLSTSPTDPFPTSHMHDNLELFDASTHGPPARDSSCEDPAHMHVSHAFVSPPESISLCLPPEPSPAPRSATAALVVTGVDLHSAAEYLQLETWALPERVMPPTKRTALTTGLQSKLLRERLRQDVSKRERAVLANSESSPLLEMQWRRGFGSDDRNRLPGSSAEDSSLKPSSMVPTSQSSGGHSSICDKDPEHGASETLTPSARSSRRLGEIQCLGSGHSSAGDSAEEGGGAQPQPQPPQEGGLGRDSAASVERVSIRCMHTQSSGTSPGTTPGSTPFELVGGRVVRVSHRRSAPVPTLVASIVSGVFPQSGGGGGSSGSSSGYGGVGGYRGSEQARLLQDGEDEVRMGEAAREDGTGFSPQALGEPPVATAETRLERNEGSEHSTAGGGGSSAGSGTLTFIGLNAAPSNPPRATGVYPAVPNPAESDSGPDFTTRGTGAARSSTLQSSSEAPTPSASAHAAPVNARRQAAPPHASPRSGGAASAAAVAAAPAAMRAGGPASAAGAVHAAVHGPAAAPAGSSEAARQRSNFQEISSKYPTQLPSTDSGSLEAAASELQQQEALAAGARAIQDAQAMRHQLPQPRPPLVPQPASKRDPSPTPGGSPPPPPPPLVGPRSSADESPPQESQPGRGVPAPPTAAPPVATPPSATPNITSSSSPPFTMIMSSSSSSAVGLPTLPPNTPGPGPSEPPSTPHEPQSPNAAIPTRRHAPPALFTPGTSSSPVSGKSSSSISRDMRASETLTSPPSGHTERRSLVAAPLKPPPHAPHAQSDTRRRDPTAEISLPAVPIPLSHSAISVSENLEIRLESSRTLLQNVLGASQSPVMHGATQIPPQGFATARNVPYTLPEPSRSSKMATRHVFNPLIPSSTDTVEEDTGESRETRLMHTVAMAATAELSESSTLVDSSTSASHVITGSATDTAALSVPISTNLPPPPPRPQIWGGGAAEESTGVLPHAPDACDSEPTDTITLDSPRGWSGDTAQRSSPGPPTEEGGLVALATLPQAISGDLGPIWADSGHSSLLAVPSMPRAGVARGAPRHAAQLGSHSVATSAENSSGASGSVSLSLPAASVVATGAHASRNMLSSSRGGGAGNSSGIVNLDPMHASHGGPVQRSDPAQSQEQTLTSIAPVALQPHFSQRGSAGPEVGSGYRGTQRVRRELAPGASRGAWRPHGGAMKRGGGEGVAEAAEMVSQETSALNAPVATLLRPTRERRRSTTDDASAVGGVEDAARSSGDDSLVLMR